MAKDTAVISNVDDIAHSIYEVYDELAGVCLPPSYERDEPTLATSTVIALLRAQTVIPGESGSAIPRFNFEMKQASKGQRYYDIKINAVDGMTVKEAIQLYDELDNELSARALLGE